MVQLRDLPPGDVDAIEAPLGDEKLHASRIDTASGVS